MRRGEGNEIEDVHQTDKGQRDIGRHAAQRVEERGEQRGQEAEQNGGFVEGANRLRRQESDEP